MGNGRIAEKIAYKNKDVKSCGFSNRTYWALKRSGINDMYMLIHKFNSGEIRDVKGIGEVSYAEIDRYFVEQFPEILKTTGRP